MTEVENVSLVLSIASFLIVTLLAIITFFLKQFLKETKDTAATVAVHAKLLAAHEVMFKVWLEDLLDGKEHPHRRRTDHIKELLIAAAKPENDPSERRR